jgi:hypothetical protein
MFCKFIVVKRSKTFILIISLIAGSLMHSCTKSDHYSYPQGTKFIFAGYTDFQPVRAFASSGEIYDSSLLAGLLTGDSFYLAESIIRSSLVNPTFDSLYFEANNTGIAYPFLGGIWEFVTTRSGNELTVTATHPQPRNFDTTFATAVDSAIAFYPYLLSNRHYEYSPLYGPFYAYDWTSQGFGTQSGPDTIIMPAIMNGFIEPAGALVLGIYNNRFNPSFDYHLLPVGDTLVFREFSMVMHKK